MGVAIRLTFDPREPPARDHWLDAMTKLIPGEGIVAFTAALQLDRVARSLGAQLAIALALLGLAPLALWASARRAATPAPALQYLVRGAVFALYAAALSPGLVECLGTVRCIAGAGTFVVPLLAALVIAPPAR